MQENIMQIQKVISQDTMVVTLIGKLDTRTSPEFQKDCATWPAGPVIIDLASLEYLSSAGLRVLLQIKRDMARRGSPVVIAGTRGLVDKVIRVSGFEQVFLLCPSVEEAMQAVSTAGA
jgi:anti-sigma B factor antagonist